MNTLLKALKSRTVWYGIVIMALGGAQMFAQDIPVRPLYQALFYLTAGLFIIILRFDTDDSISDK